MEESFDDEGFALCQAPNRVIESTAIRHKREARSMSPKSIIREIYERCATFKDDILQGEINLIDPDTPSSHSPRSALTALDA